MKIEKRTAKEIVLKLSETIGQNINIMNTDGMIIASSDPSREGKVHGAALKLIHENLTQVVVETNEQFPGSRNGVNLPVVFDNEVVGVIGITGTVSEVLKYGEIIKKMTEILLLEERTKDLHVIEQKARDRFLNEWLADGLEERSPARFLQMAAEMSVDTSIPYRVIAIAPCTSFHPAGDTLTEISRLIRREVSRELGGNAYRTALHMILIVPEENISKLDRVMTGIRAQVMSTFSCPLRIGASDTPAVLHLSDAHKRAVFALERALEADLPETVTYYDPFDINFLLHGLPAAARTDFLDALFKDASAEIRRNYLDFASVYLEENGSLDTIAERLFVHPNTVKYRIQKLTQLTGIDIRTCRGTYIFSLACMLRSP